MSANFEFSGNSLFDTALLKSNCKALAVTSALYRSIFGGILLCVVALFEFKPLISLLMSDRITCSKQKALVFFYSFMIIKILG